MRLIENWFSERYSDNVQLSFRVRDQLLSVKTDYQRIDLFDTYDFGKLLAIDGTVQLTEYDEYIYHEMITMMPFFHSVRKPETALIIGGGDGGAARSLLGLGVRDIVNVEIDSQVVEISKKYFPELAASFSDRRCRLIIGDGIDYVRKSEQKFDLIIIDSTDPEGPAVSLFSREFYEMCAGRLSESGIVVAQSGSPFYQRETFRMAYDGMVHAFPHVKVYTAFIPTYPSGFWSFTMGSNSVMNPVKDMVRGKYFNQEIAEGAFKLPQFMLDDVSTLKGK